MSQILIAFRKYGDDNSDVWMFTDNDKDLEKAILTYKSTLDILDIETFEHRNNIIATEKGFYLALWDKDVKLRVKSKIAN